MLHCHKGLQVFENLREFFLHYHILRVCAIPTYRVNQLYGCHVLCMLGAKEVTTKLSSQHFAFMDYCYISVYVQ